MQKCACCGNYSLEDDSLFEICDVCNWQQDAVMEDNPDYTGGANYDMSLNEARKYWNKYHKPIPKRLFHKTDTE